MASPDAQMGEKRATCSWVPKPTQEQCLLPAHSTCVGTCGRREMHSPRWEGEDKMTDGCGGKAGCSFQMTEQDWRGPEEGAQTARRQAPRDGGSAGLLSLTPSPVSQPLPRLSAPVRRGFQCPHSFWPGPSCMLLALLTSPDGAPSPSSSAYSHGPPLWPAFVTSLHPVPAVWIAPAFQTQHYEGRREKTCVSRPLYPALCPHESWIGDGFPIREVERRLVPEDVEGLSLLILVQRVPGAKGL